MIGMLEMSSNPIFKIALKLNICHKGEVICPCLLERDSPHLKDMIHCRLMRLSSSLHIGDLSRNNQTHVANL